MLKGFLRWVTFLTAGLLSISANAAPSYYSSSASFQSQLGTSVTDDYSNAGYIFIQNNATMSAVLGETDYQSTGFTDLNIVTGGYYCAGCNGSFKLDFTSTSVGDANGVFGVGANYLFNTGYFAFITFGDDSTANILMTGETGFFGVTATEQIKSIHFGLTGGGTTTDASGSFAIDNLTIGNQGGQVPEPASLALLGLALAGLGATRRKKLV